MEAAEASVNKLSDPSLIRFVSAAAADDADSSRYATICNFNVHKIYMLLTSATVGPIKNLKTKETHIPNAWFKVLTVTVGALISWENNHNNITAEK